MFALKALIMASLLIGSAVVFIPDNASAASSYYWSYLPSANNATLEKVYKRYTYGPVVENGIRIKNDSDYLVIHETTVAEGYPLITLTSDDFTEDTWYAYADPVPDGIVSTMPWDNGTVTIIDVRIQITISYPNPAFSVTYSLDGGSTWGTPISIAAGVFWGSYLLEVTDEEVWTPAMLNSTDLMVEMVIYPTEDVYYGIDYLGWFVKWSVPYSGGSSSSAFGEWDRTDEATSPGWDFITTEHGIVSLLGLFGLVGMVAAPALGIFAYRANPDEGKMRMFIKMLVLFMFCLTAFMYSITVT